MLKFIKFEINYWLRTPMIWIFFGLTTLIVGSLMSIDAVNLGGGGGATFKNAPYVIQALYNSMFFIGLMFISAFMVDTAMRDFVGKR